MEPGATSQDEAPCIFHVNVLIFFFSNYKTLSESESDRKLEGGEIKRITTAI